MVCRSTAFSLRDFAATSFKLKARRRLIVADARAVAHAPRAVDNCTGPVFGVWLGGCKSQDA